MTIYLVWETEYPDEGSLDVIATSAAAAKREYRKLCDGDPETQLSASRATPEMLLERHSAELVEAEEYQARLIKVIRKCRSALITSHRQDRTDAEMACDEILSWYEPA